MSDDRRNPLDDAPPTRLFAVKLQRRRLFGLLPDAIARVEGHVPQVLPDGSLQIVCYRRDVPWTVAMFAAGEWCLLGAELPSHEDIDALEAYNMRYGKKQQLMERATPTKKVH